MTLPDLIERYYEEMESADEIGATAPVAKILHRVVKDLQALGTAGDPRNMVRVSKVAEMEDVSPETVRRHCRAGLYPGARKTSDLGGDWRIPVTSLVPATQGPRRRLRG